MPAINIFLTVFGTICAISKIKTYMRFIVIFNIIYLNA